MSPNWKRIDRAGMLALAAVLLIAVTLPLLPASAHRHERLVTTAFGIVVYVVTLAGCALLFTHAARQRHGESFGNSLSRVCGWIWRWHGLVAIGLSSGAVAGALIYAVGGLVFSFDGTVAQFVRQGAMDGAFYLLIWCPGGALVWCFIQAFGPKKDCGVSEKDCHPNISGAK